MTSGRILCCAARIWALTIAWIEVAFWGFVFTFTIGLFAYFQYYQHRFDSTIIFNLIGIVIATLWLIKAIFLIIGVKKKRVGILKTWVVLQAISVVLIISVTILKWLNDILYYTIEAAVAILINVFMLWIVNTYRRQVLDERRSYQDEDYSPPIYPHMAENVEMDVLSRASNRPQ